MDLDLRPFPDLNTSLLTMAAWTAVLALLVAALAVQRREHPFDAAARYRIPLLMLVGVGGFHAMAGWQAAQLIAVSEVAVAVLLWLLALTLPLPPRVAEDEHEPAARQR